MVRRILAMVAALLLTSTSAFAQERSTVLGGVPFGAAPSAVAAAMADLGLTPAQLGGRSAFPVDQTFAGQIDGRAVLVVAMYDPSEALEKMLVTFITADTECLRFYRSFKLALTREYGETHADVEDWKAPYDVGRHIGHEEAAIRSGSGFVGATWSREDLDGTAGMSLSIAGNLTVTLAYESSRWSQELERRRKLLRSTVSGGGL